MPVVSLHTKMRLSSHAQTGKRQMTVRFTGQSRTVESLSHSSGAMCLEVAPGFLENSRTSAVVYFLGVSVGHEAHRYFSPFPDAVLLYLHVPHTLSCRGAKEESGRCLSCKGPFGYLMHGRDSNQIISE